MKLRFSDSITEGNKEVILRYRTYIVIMK